MAYQSEAELENLLIKQLGEEGYEEIEVKDYDALLSNFRQQLGVFNKEKLGGSPLLTRNGNASLITCSGILFLNPPKSSGISTYDHAAVPSAML